jgi:integral membrane protein (TIGR01906 family)
MYIVSIVAVILGFVFFFIIREKIEAMKAAIYGAYSSILLVIFTAVASAINFNYVFTVFHEILFTNDLWLLDPRTDNLIRMMPEGLFMDIALRWLIVMIGISIVIIFGMQYLRKREIKKEIN